MHELKPRAEHACTHACAPTQGNSDAIWGLLNHVRTTFASGRSPFLGRGQAPHATRAEGAPAHPPTELYASGLQHALAPFMASGEADPLGWGDEGAGAQQASHGRQAAAKAGPSPSQRARARSSSVPPNLQRWASLSELTFFGGRDGGRDGAAGVGGRNPSGFTLSPRGGPGQQQGQPQPQPGAPTVVDARPPGGVGVGCSLGPTGTGTGLLERPLWPSAQLPYLHAEVLQLESSVLRFLLQVGAIAPATAAQVCTRVAGGGLWKAAGVKGRERERVRG